MDFFSLFVDFIVYIMKSTDFFNICEPNIIQIVYFLVLEDSGGLYLFGNLYFSLLKPLGESFSIYITLYNCLSIQICFCFGIYNVVSWWVRSDLFWLDLKLYTVILDILINPQNIRINPQISVTFLQISRMSLRISVKSMDLSKSK